jgi:hypothetical protein
LVEAFHWNPLVMYVKLLVTVTMGKDMKTTGADSTRRLIY